MPKEYHMSIEPGWLQRQINSTANNQCALCGGKSSEQPVASSSQEMDLLQWLKTKHPEVFEEQKHLDEGTPECVYWHYGRWSAFKDVYKHEREIANAVAKIEAALKTLEQYPHDILTNDREKLRNLVHRLFSFEVQMRMNYNESKGGKL